MKIFIIKSIIFLALFFILFLYVQNVLHYRWPDDTYSKMVDYREQIPDSIDVAVFGTSEMYAAFAPIISYRDEGITGFNFAVQNRSALTTYYQFEYMMKYQTPKLVVCDFVCLFDNALPSDSETIFRRVVDTMPDSKIRMDLIREICKVDPSQEFLNWYFPVFRYHTMWKEIKAENFTWDTKLYPFYATYQKGGQLLHSDFSGEPITVTEDLWETDRATDPIQEFSIQYYDRIIAECRKRNIPVVCILTPKLSDAAVYASNAPAMQAYFDDRDITFLNYCTYEQVERMGLSQPEDYMDSAHLNIRGAEKFSKAVAEDLRALFPDLPDRRKDMRIKDVWDADVDAFEADR